MRDRLPTRALVVLDIGHGNAAVLLTPEGVGIIDAGPGPALIKLLNELEVREIDWLLLSHADQDHIGGAVALLADGRFRVHRLRANPDSTKRTVAWDDLIYEADANEGVDFQPGLTPGSAHDYRLGDISVEVLSPSAYLVSKGAGGRDRENRRIVTNSLSAVVRVIGAGNRVLLPGDLDRVGLDDALRHQVDLSCDTLVWPQHGSNPGSKGDSFVSDLCSAVRPAFVVFSIGRNKFENPRPELVRDLRRQLGSQVRIACTQLSRNCAQTLGTSDLGHLSAVFSLGRISGEACAGSIVVDLDSGCIFPDSAAHRSFIERSVPMALCFKKWGTDS